MHDDAVPTIQSLSFLVVDDESFIQEVTVKILKKLGATDIATAANGIEALDYLDAASSDVDVMLIDIRMPEMDGVELMQQLAERKYAGAIILVSGIDELTVSVAEGMAKMRNLNVLSHINKPLKLDTLAEVLKCL
jgi:YesN/AraC family two-component response regulator